MPRFLFGLTALMLFTLAMAAPVRAAPGIAGLRVDGGSIVRVQAYHDDDDDEDYDDRPGYRSYRPAYAPPPYPYEAPRYSYVAPPYPYHPGPYSYGYARPAPYAPTYYAPRRVIAPPPAVIIAPAPVYAYQGWSPAGGCGTYRYWNGERCVDARRKHDYRW